MAETRLEYYFRRRQQALTLLAAATSPEAASAHQAMALTYAEEVRRLMPREPNLRLVVSNDRN